MPEVHVNHIGIIPQKNHKRENDFSMHCHHIVLGLVGVYFFLLQQTVGVTIYNLGEVFLP